MRIEFVTHLWHMASSTMLALSTPSHERLGQGGIWVGFEVCSYFPSQELPASVLPRRYLKIGALRFFFFETVILIYKSNNTTTDATYENPIIKKLLGWWWLRFSWLFENRPLVLEFSPPTNPQQHPNSHRILLFDLLQCSAAAHLLNPLSCCLHPFR
jgi:hypothetical protein